MLFEPVMLARELDALVACVDCNKCTYSYEFSILCKPTKRMTFQHIYFSRVDQRWKIKPCDSRHTWERIMRRFGAEAVKRFSRNWGEVDPKAFRALRSNTDGLGGDFQGPVRRYPVHKHNHTYYSRNEEHLIS